MTSAAAAVPAPEVEVTVGTRVLLGVVLVTALADLAISGLTSSEVAWAATGLVVVAQLVSTVPVVRRALVDYPVALLGVAVIALSMPLTNPWMVLFATLFLGLGWDTVNRALAPLFSSVFLVLIASARLPIDEHQHVVAMWGVAVVATLASLARDGQRARQRLDDPPQWVAVGRSSPNDSRRRVVEVAGVMVAMLLVVPPAAAKIARATEPLASRRGDGSSGAGAYWGFGDELDTAVRGELGDEIVMRVRSEVADFWRAQTFDVWDGRVWSRSGGRPTLLRGEVIEVPPSDGDLSAARRPGDVAVRELNQTFTIERSGDGTIFAAYRGAVVDAPVDRLVRLDDGSMKAPRALGRGTVYGVTSWKPVVTADELRSRDPRQAGVPPDLAARYLDASALSPRARQVGADLAGGATSTYDAVVAMEAWLGANVTYHRAIPPLPDGADAVDQFLFVDKAGFCEQIATTLALWVRAMGVPARVAVGFAPGEQNPLSGDWLVRARDAHAWVEVWFPGVGWQPFDPTASVPLSGEEAARAPSVMEPLLGLLWVPTLAVIGAAALWLGIAHLLRRRLSSGVGRGSTSHRAHALVRSLEAEGARRGCARRADATLLEHARAMRESVLSDDRVLLVGHRVSEALFAAGPPASLDEAERMWRDVLAEHPFEAAGRRRATAGRRAAWARHRLGGGRARGR